MSYKKFIDSVIGNIARKIEDEFNENDHPRDKGGKFTSKGGEGKGGSKDPIPETETEKAAKEELGEREQKLAAMKKEDEEFNKMSNELVEIASDLDTANDALRALGWDNDYDDLEQAHEALKEAIKRDPEKAKELLESTPGRGEENEELIQVKRAAKAARRFKSSGIDLASAMEDLDIPTEGVPEAYLEEVFEGNLAEDPKLLRKAEDYIERYESGELEDAAPKKNRLGRNPLEKIDNSDPGDTGVGSIIKKTGK